MFGRLHADLRRNRRHKIEGSRRSQRRKTEHGRICHGRQYGKLLLQKNQKCLGSDESSRRFIRWFCCCGLTVRYCRFAGSDTGGSIRQPAAFNGIVGMKPTYGRVSRYGLITFASAANRSDQARNVTDNALLLEAISGYDKRDSTKLNMEVPKFSANLNGKVAGMKIALPKEYFQDGVSAEIQEAVEAVLNSKKWALP